MAFLKRQRRSPSFWRQGIRSNPETLSRTLDFEPDTVIEFTKSATGMWQFPTIPEKCCIYRVPQRLRRVNPEAYTPQLVLIGPLHHSLKLQALRSVSLGDTTKTKAMGYLNMERYKHIYLEKFADRLDGNNTIVDLRRIIEADEEKIRASYSESTSWIESPDFVEMILLDSVFILEHMLRINDASYVKTKKREADADAEYERRRTEKKEDNADYEGRSTKKTKDDAYADYDGPKTEKIGDLIVDDPGLHGTIREDLVLLENQLPYFIFEKLFDPIFPRLCPQEIPNQRPNQTLRDLVITYFGPKDEKIKVESKFIHFTDLLRCVGVDTSRSENPSKTIFRCLVELFPWVRSGSKKKPVSKEVKYHSIKHMYNAAKLHNAGVKFVVDQENKFAMDVSFTNGCLKLPCLWFDEYMEIILRNIMALEQCHYPSNARVSNFITFLDFLIENDKDLDLLFETGILHKWIGDQKSVAKMVNKLRLGLSIDNYSYYNDIALEVNAYYDNPINRTRAILDRMYFGNLWQGTATFAATLLLVMTLIQTVASVIQVMQK